MKKQMPLIHERAKADLRLIFLMARSKGISAIQARNPRSKFGKERISSIAEKNAKQILIMNNGISCFT
jgi:hypothetical protein